MVRSFCLTSVVIVVLTAGLTGQQERPNFSGRWTLVAERSTPAGPRPAFGDAFTIAQQTTFIEFDTVVSSIQLTSQGGQLSAAQSTASRNVTKGYETDGAEHEMPPPEARPGVTMMIQSTTSYRAVWTTGQLIIVEYNKATAAARGADLAGQITSVVRTAFSLDPDGSLVVDRIGVVMPRPNGPKQEPPVPTRTVYKKAK